MSKVTDPWCVVRGLYVQGHDLFCMVRQGFILPRSWSHGAWSGVRMSKVIVHSQYTQW